MKRVLPLLTSLLLLASTTTVAEDSLSATYREDAGRIIGRALVSDNAADTLAYLCDRFGHRLSGSPQLEAATDWAKTRMEHDGLANVRKDKVMVPHWVRGKEHAYLAEPTKHRLNILGLGGSVATPVGGIDAEVVVVTSFDELEPLGEAGLKGKIVLYDVPFTTYGETVKYRGHGASRAAEFGAVAAVVRSVSPVSWDTPHTGALRYDEKLPKIPGVAVSIEGAAMMHRMYDRGEKVVMHLEMEAETLPDAESANLIAEVVGSELPNEIVVIGGHIDSWDVGQGAQDDGVGSIIAWEAARLIHELDLKPRRTIRVVLFTNEENGTRGGKDYAKRYADQLPNHVAAIESDIGNGLAHGFHFQLPYVSSKDKDKGAELIAREEQLRAKAIATLEEIASLLEPLGSTRITAGGSGADIGASVAQGVPGLGIDHDRSRYWYIHHTRADTFDKIDLVDLKKNVATMAVMAYVLADMPGRLLTLDELESIAR